MSIKNRIFALFLTAALLTAVSVAADVSVGDVVTFGRYEQDNRTDNGPEPIEWMVIEVEENGDVQLLSRWVLDKGSYSEKNMRTSWSKSSLRAWLNSSFYDAAFTDAEKSLIVAKSLATRYEPEITTDPVTLMACPDGLRLFKDYPSRQGQPTAYAVAQGCYVSKKNNPYTHWWTRNPSWEDNYKASYIAANGGVMKCGGKLTIPNYGIRPVIYVNVKDLPAQ